MTQRKIKILPKSAESRYRRMGFIPTDVGRNKEQAIFLAEGTPPDYEVVIIATSRNTGNPEIFPYHIWTKSPY